MCDRAVAGLVRALTLAVVMLVLTVVSSRAQSVEELEARVAELELRWQAATTVFEASQAAARHPVSLDTVTVGRLTVVGTEQDLSLLRPGIAPAWDALRESLGADTGLLDGVRMTVTRTEVLAPSEMNMSTTLGSLFSVFGRSPVLEERQVVGYAFSVSVAPDDNMVANVVTSLDPDAEESTDLLVYAAWSAIGQLLPPEVVAWGGSDARPRVAGTASVYHGILTGTVRIGRDCLKGILPRCQDGLGLSPADDFDSWYDAEDLRRLVARYDADSWSYGTLASKHRLCVADNDYDACRDYLLGRLGPMLEPPFDMQARRLALAVAVDMGGDGALGRLIRSEGTMAQRLESVAGVPVDAIVARWHAVVVDAAGQSVVLSPATAAFSLLWILLLGMAAARNAKWR